MANWTSITQEKAVNHPLYGVKGIAALFRVLLVVIPGLGLLQVPSALLDIMSSRQHLLPADYLLAVPAVVFFMWSGHNAILLGKHKSEFFTSFNSLLIIGPIISVSVNLIWIAMNLPQFNGHF